MAIFVLTLCHLGNRVILSVSTLVIVTHHVLIPEHRHCMCMYPSQ